MLNLLTLICAPTAASDLDALMKQLAALPGLEAKFTEQKHITLLAAPLSSAGVLRFSPPAMLSRETTKPVTSRVVIVKNRLFFDDGKNSQEVDVGNNPIVRAFVNSFVLLLAGDRKGLEELFDMKLIQGKQSAKRAETGARASPERDPGPRWQLELVPKKEPVSKIIKRMLVHGSGVKLEKLIVEESTGDRTETTFVDVNTDRRFSDAEKQKYFRTK